MRKPILKLKQATPLFALGGCLQVPRLRMAYPDSTYGSPSGIFDIVTGVASCNWYTLPHYVMHVISFTFSRFLSPRLTYSHPCFAYILDLTKTKLVEMPSCNLAEIVHSKWLQESGDRGKDL